MREQILKAVEEYNKDIENNNYSWFELLFGPIACKAVDIINTAAENGIKIRSDIVTSKLYEEQ